MEVLLQERLPDKSDYITIASFQNGETLWVSGEVTEDFNKVTIQLHKDKGVKYFCKANIIVVFIGTVNQKTGRPHIHYITFCRGSRPTDLSVGFPQDIIIRPQACEALLSINKQPYHTRGGKKRVLVYEDEIVLARTVQSSDPYVWILRRSQLAYISRAIAAKKQATS